MTFDPDSLISSAQQRRAGCHASFYRAVDAGVFVRLARGIYLPNAEWVALTADDRHLARAHAFATANPGTVFGYRTAGAIWGLPGASGWPTRVETITDEHGASSGRFAVRHADGYPRDAVEVGGLRVTPLLRTLVDVAASAQLSTSVAMLDFALGAAARDATRRNEFPVSIDAVDDERIRQGRRRGAVGVRRSLELADGRSGSPGESVSRVGFHVLGAPMPDLQRIFVDDEGEMFTDFWWEDFCVFGEFDGLGKYVKPEFLRPGESTADAVIREKKREDRIRAIPPYPRAARWDWPTAWTLPRLERTLRVAGVHW